eukprot:scaffold310_cov168-Amphora_coffeaeformis.AAC.19
MDSHRSYVIMRRFCSFFTIQGNIATCAKIWRYCTPTSQEGKRLGRPASWDLGKPRAKILLLFLEKCSSHGTKNSARK